MSWLIFFPNEFGALFKQLVGGRKQEVGYVEVKDIGYTMIQLHVEENILKKHCKNMVCIYLYTVSFQLVGKHPK